MTIPPGPAMLREEDVKRARRDPRHKAKRLEERWLEAVRKLRRKIVNWFLDRRAKSGAAKQGNQNVLTAKKLSHLYRSGR